MITEDEKSLLTVECLVNKENSENLYWGVKTWETSVGEMRLRIFNLLGNNSVGRMLTLLGKSGVWIVCQSTGDSELRIRVNCYLIDSQTFKIS